MSLVAYTKSTIYSLFSLIFNFPFSQWSPINNTLSNVKSESEEKYNLDEKLTSTLAGIINDILVILSLQIYIFLFSIFIFGVVLDISTLS